jgi:hypothetical protein
MSFSGNYPNLLKKEDCDFLDDLIQKIETQGFNVEEITEELKIKSEKLDVSNLVHRILVKKLKRFKEIRCERFARSLGCWGGSISVIPLIDVLDRNNLKYNFPSTYREVCEALGRIGDNRAVEPLIEKLSMSHSRAGRYEADALALCSQGGDIRALKILVRQLVKQNPNDLILREFSAARSYCEAIYEILELYRFGQYENLFLIDHPTVYEEDWVYDNDQIQMYEDTRNYLRAQQKYGGELSDDFSDDSDDWKEHYNWFLSIDRMECPKCGETPIRKVNLKDENLDIEDALRKLGLQADSSEYIFSCDTYNCEMDDFKCPKIV